ncbi:MULTISPECIES: hypothetical protein [unclassified Nocardiopsis]|uniref:hypothetical protein n=1 Tax=unclassified Nocardiopsis TaxID=2649073 RepID=UPI00066D956B|nr:MULTISPECIES: hypothetical protein [unclassified Nocardiopsis]MBQ1081924.1 hypothetical protein [Nocardiopsis sp. B62]
MRSLTLTAVATAAAGLLLTGCGAIGGDDAADPESTEEKTMEEAMLDYAACMRDAGFDMPDPDSDGGMVALPAMEEPDEEMLAAMEECDALLPVDENAPSEEEQFESDLMVAECLRENGIDVEDPERGMGLAIPVDPEDDEHMAAVSSCTEEGGRSLELEAGPEDDS